MKQQPGYIKELEECYSDQAEHFHNTRKKFWPEVDFLADELDGFLKSREISGDGAHDGSDAHDGSINFLDLGCGSGRLSERLAKKLGEDFDRIDYTGVDIAQGMIDLARKTYPKRVFKVDSMYNYLSSLEQESVDFCVALASFQHVKGVKEQQALLLALYKAMRWGGKVVLINWSFSNWFLQKYYKNIFTAAMRSLVSSDRSWNDLIIPRKDKAYQQNNISYERMYHIYTIHELKKLATMSSFVTKNAGFILQDGSVSTDGSDWTKSRNSFLVLEKTINSNKD